MAKLKTLAKPDPQKKKGGGNKTTTTTNTTTTLNNAPQGQGSGDIKLVTAGGTKVNDSNGIYDDTGTTTTKKTKGTDTVVTPPTPTPAPPVTKPTPFLMNRPPSTITPPPVPSSVTRPTNILGSGLGNNNTNITLPPITRTPGTGITPPSLPNLPPSMQRPPIQVGPNPTPLTPTPLTPATKPGLKPPPTTTPGVKPIAAGPKGLKTTQPVTR